MYRTESTHYKATGRYFAPPFSISSLYIKLPWLAYTPVRSFIFPITKVHFNLPQTLFPPLLLRLLLLSHKVFHCPEKFLL